MNSPDHHPRECWSNFHIARYFHIWKWKRRSSDLEADVAIDIDMQCKFNDTCIQRMKCSYMSWKTSVGLFSYLSLTTVLQSQPTLWPSQCLHIFHHVVWFIYNSTTSIPEAANLGQSSDQPIRFCLCCVGPFSRPEPFCVSDAFGSSNDISCWLITFSFC